MEKITLNEYLKQGSVVENLKNFVGVTPENTVGLMTPERLAAVAGGLQFKGKIEKDANLDDYTENGRYFITANHTTFTSGGILYVLKIGVYVHQLFFSIDCYSFRTRVKGFSGEWMKWTGTQLSPFS